MSNTRSALVVGGGIAGMTVALSLAKQGYPVNLVEQSESLGGHDKGREGQGKHEGMTHAPKLAWSRVKRKTHKLGTLTNYGNWGHSPITGNWGHSPITEIGDTHQLWEMGHSPIKLTGKLGTLTN